MVNLLKLCLAGLRGEETEAAMVNYLIPTKKTCVKIFKKKHFFQNHCRVLMVEELFAYIFGIYIKFGNKNPSILAPSNSVDVVT